MRGAEDAQADDGQMWLTINNKQLLNLAGYSRLLGGMVAISDEGLHDRTHRVADKTRVVAFGVVRAVDGVHLHRRTIAVTVGVPGDGREQTPRFLFYVSADC